jgi:serine protease Do
MSSRSWRSALLLVSIGIVIGAVVFSQLYAPTRPEVFGTPSPETTSTTKAADRPMRSLRDWNQAFGDIAESVNPTVVTVFTEKVLRVRTGTNPFFRGPFSDFFKDFFGQPGPRGQQAPEREFRSEGLGSGVIVDSKGIIITNNHVISGADTIRVRLMDDRTIPATVVGADTKTDIAVLKVETDDDLPAIAIGDSDDLKVGEWVLAIGSPLSPNLAHTVTSGIVSAKGRSNVGLAEYEDFIQTDAAINPGNSGGALVDVDGKLVGINTAIASRTGGYQGIGFAVPVNMARRIMESIIEHGTVVRGWLGVYIQDLNQNMVKAMDLPVSKGALVADVTDDSPAAEAGLEQGDVIVELNGEKVHDTTQLRNDVAATAPGTDVTLKLYRDGKEKEVKVTLGKLKADEIAPETEQRLSDLFGFEVAPFTPDLAQKYGLKPSLKGVVITGIDADSPARRAGLAEGDLIVAVNRKGLGTMEEFNDLVQDLKKGDTVLLQVARQNRNMFVAFRL